MDKHMHINLHMQKMFFKRSIEEWFLWERTEKNGVLGQWKIFWYFTVFVFIFYISDSLIL